MLNFIKLIEKYTKISFKIKKTKFQIGDVIKTYADTRTLKQLTKKNSHIKIYISIKLFINWYKKYYNLP